MSDKIYKKYLPIIVCLLQLMGLFLLRQLWLRTVFQTVATYLLLCTAGVSFLLLSQMKKNAHMAAAMGLLPDLLERHSLCNRPWTHDMRYLLSYLDPGHLCSNRQFIFRLRPLLVSVPTLQKA